MSLAVARSAPRNLDDEVWIKSDALSLLVLPDVTFFVLRCDGLSGVSGRLLLESSVYVFGKEPHLALFRREVPDLVDLKEGVSQFDCFEDLGGALGPPGECIARGCVGREKISPTEVSPSLFARRLNRGER